MTTLPMKGARLNFVYLIGRPGAGKDTQIKRYLEQNPDVANIPIGDIFRRGQNPQDPQYGSYFPIVSPHKTGLDRGQYIPGEAIAAVVKKATKPLIAGGKTTFIVNAHPRGLSQLEQLEEMTRGLTEDGFETRSLFIYLGVTRNEAESRRLGESGGDGYMPRADDKPDVLKTRLDIFEESSRPMLKEILARAKSPNSDTRLEIVRGNRSEDQVGIEITQAIDSFIAN